jgi:hypothetical protein
MTGQTFLERIVRRDVCSHKTSLVMPLVPAIIFADVTQPLIAGGAWLIVLVLWLILWLAVPCNPNLNCTAKTPRGKDGTKALLVSFLIVYGVLFGVAVAARIFICTNGKHSDPYGGGILTNLQSLFTMGKVKKGPYGTQIESLGNRSRALSRLEHAYGHGSEIGEQLHGARDQLKSQFGSIAASLAKHDNAFRGHMH